MRSPRSCGATRWRSPTAGFTISPRRTCPAPDAAPPREAASPADGQTLPPGVRESLAGRAGGQHLSKHIAPDPATAVRGGFPYLTRGLTQPFVGTAICVT